VNFSIGGATTGRFYVYYELRGFQQNHFRFQGSFSSEQLRGKYVESPLSCTPLFSDADGRDLMPCGLYPFYFFRDSYDLDPYFFDETGISWEKEVGSLFKAPDPSGPYNSSRFSRHLLQWAERFPGETENEHFVVWMRTAKGPVFRKLWAKARGGQIPALVNVTIHCDFPFNDFTGERHLVLVKVGGLGGRNMFIMIVTWALFLLFAIFAALFKLSCCPLSRTEPDFWKIRGQYH
jgi:hypothetical protein